MYFSPAVVAPCLLPPRDRKQSMKQNKKGRNIKLTSRNVRNLSNPERKTRQQAVLPALSKITSRNNHKGKKWTGKDKEKEGGWSHSFTYNARGKPPLASLPV